MANNKILLAFYGDDFTGSTDAMEAVTKSGYRTVLFLSPPSKEMLQKFQGISCVGVAGTSRAKAPKDMKDELDPIMEKLSESGAAVVHYKTCSTFDSSPEVGSIGAAIDISLKYFKEQKTVPIIVGAPQLGRYTLFGNHFAKMKDIIYRLDRHPIMSRHPITPMQEADLRLHLSKQMEGKIGLISILDLDKEFEEINSLYKKKCDKGNKAILFDVVDEEKLDKASKLIWETSQNQPLLVVGSSGVEYGLASYWNKIYSKTEKSLPEWKVKPVSTVLAVSGSASEVTKDQIEFAVNNGFYGIKIPIEILISQDSLVKEFLQDAIDKLKNGKSVILYTAFGPNDDSINETKKYFIENGISLSDSGEFIGKRLGQWTKFLKQQSGVSRVIVAGGDTSGFVASEMGIYGLEMILSISPGAPLCTVYSDEEEMNGTELALKGGQFGEVDYFVRVKNARTNII
ncbi:four-carbon acid sugar kinase family protein [Planococcus sp. X10-3]|uniref:four-carbon acid sugar kinase family protein n=1 Tax=Planococcus sp. X10-3 TaxID=3061240 RepID=UPI003BB03ADC